MYDIPYKQLVIIKNARISQLLEENKEMENMSKGNNK